MKTAFIFLFTTMSILTYGFSPTEIANIGTPDQGLMRLCTIDNTSDSIFLRQLSRKLTQAEIESDIFATLKTRMLATVCDTTNAGVGIAAPQVGVGVRLIAVQRLDKEDEPFEFYANPKIICFGAENADSQEGCLSVPNQNGTVNRSRKITLTYTDQNTFETVTETIEGFTAVIFQHEIDHLDAILYIDKMNKMSAKRIIEYTPQGVCSRKIEITIQNDTVTNVKFTGGCSGNTQGVARLVKGMAVSDVVAKLKGINCKDKGTSCPDQLAKALEQ